MDIATKKLFAYIFNIKINTGTKEKKYYSTKLNSDTLIIR